MPYLTFAQNNADLSKIPLLLLNSIGFHFYFVNKNNVELQCLILLMFFQERLTQFFLLNPGNSAADLGR